MAEKIVPIQEMRIINPILEQVRKGLELTQPDKSVREEMLRNGITAWDFSKNRLIGPLGHVAYFVFLGPTPTSIQIPGQYQLLVNLNTANDFYRNSFLKMSNMRAQSSSWFNPVFVVNQKDPYIKRDDPQITFFNEAGTETGGQGTRYFAHPALTADLKSIYAEFTDCTLVTVDNNFSEFLVDKYSNTRYNPDSDFVLVTKITEHPRPKAALTNRQ